MTVLLLALLMWSVADMARMLARPAVTAPPPEPPEPISPAVAARLAAFHRRRLVGARARYVPWDDLSSEGSIGRAWAWLCGTSLLTPAQIARGGGPHGGSR